MHGANFVIQDMMMADSPRMLSEKEKETLKKKKQKVKLNDDKDLQKELKQMFG